MRKQLAAFVVLVLCFAMTGCGGCGISDDVIRKAAQRQRAPETPDPGNGKPAQAAAATGDDAQPAAVAAKSQGTSDQAAAATDKAATAAAQKPIVTNEKPAEPLTEPERRARSMDNLEKIGKALAAYTKKKNGKFPPQATSRDGEAFLSWRVMILPELGYPELRQRFKHEPWDSPHNKILLDYIPPEYQSPERFDVKTNYLGISGRGTFLPDLEGLHQLEIKDGPDNTLAVVEVDDKYALEWTRPEDHVPAFDLPANKLGRLRGEGAFGLLASGRVVLLPKEMPPSRLAALFTTGGGEPVAAAALQPPTPEPPPPMLATIADDPTAANQTAPTDDAASSPAAPPPMPPVFPGTTAAAPTITKELVPDEESLVKARELLKELYGEEFKKARKPEEQREFLKKLFDNAVNVEQNASDYHELVRIARDMAAALGDVSQALAACELLEQRFQVDSMQMRVDVLTSVNKRAGELDKADAALKEAQRLWREGFEADRYEIALPACELALSFARINSDKPEITKLTQQVNSLETARTLHFAATRAFDTLQANPGDAAAHEAVGRYVCLVKNRWDAGLPHLSMAHDIRLRGIASIELAPNRSLQETLALAEQCWELAGKFKPPQRRGLHLRAVYCYGLVEPKLATSLEKVKAKRRIDEAITLYGREEIDRVLAPLRPKQPIEGESLSAN